MKSHRVTGVLCCLVLLSRAGRTSSRQISKFHESLAEEELERYFGTRDKRSVPDYDIVHPVHLSGSRHRRSLMSPKPPLEYQLDAFGGKYHLKLKHNNELIAPGCLVTLTGEGKGETTPCPVKGDNCYYHGYSLNHNNSQAALSTCRGLHGIISTKEHQLVIQPIKYRHVAATNNKVTAPAPHLIYKLSDRSRRHCPLESAAEHISKMVHHRARRQTRDLTIEMLLVADKTMYRHHGDDLTNYMLTAANVASARYLDYSLGVPIKLSIIRLRILQNDVAGLEIIPDADLTLTSFCEWQEKFNPPSDQHPQHVDAASLMTRTDLVHKGVKDTTGLASLGGMCVSKQRCSVLEDNGLDIGLTLAHETGHSLNMDHDSDGNICDDKKNIMSTGGAGGGTAFQWSRCSRESLLHFIFDGKTGCLSDHPQGQVLALPRDMPGVLYPGDDQCRLFLGEGSRICLNTSLVEPYGGDECGKLVCFDPNLPGQCTGSQAPRMDGTECGNRKWCISGQCQDIGPDGPPAVDGGWSAWDNSQSECSRSCGGGVRVRSRKCDNPRPLFGGKKCEGFATKAVMCNFEPCSTSQEKYKEEQCAATDRYPLHGFYKHWLPGDTIGESVCMLFCHPEGEETIHLRGVGSSTLYQDGTQCSDAKGVYNRCVKGECRPFGCDGVSDSPARPDVCGACQGHNDTCIKRKGSYFKGEVNEYITFLTLPKGSTGIKMTNDNRYTWMSIKVNGKRLFNTNGRQKNRKDIYKQDGVTVLYAPYRPESIQIEGPIPVEIEAQVYRVYGDAYEDVTPIIYYEYYEPLNNVASNTGPRFDAIRPAAPEYKWMTIDGQCSVTCGQGSLRVGATCVQISTSQRVDRTLCDTASEPRSYTKSCTEKSCPSRWTVGSYSGCSKTCDGGLKTRSVQCVRSDGQTDRVVSDGQCGFNTRPSRTETCGTQDCPGEWATSRWSDCSVSCGPGTRHRQVGCFSPSDSRLEDSVCIQRDRPSTQGSCNNGECPVVQSTPAVAGDGCHDNKTAECDSYRKEICTRYTEWARNHCPVYCGMCPVPVPVEATAQGEATTKTGETVANEQQGQTAERNTIGRNDEHVDSSGNEKQVGDPDSNNAITTDKGQTGDSVDSQNNNEIVRDSSTKDNNEIVRDSSTKDNNEIVRDSSTKDNNEIVRDSSTKDNNEIVRDSSTKDNNEIVRDSSTKDNNEIVRDSSTKDNNEIVRDSSSMDNNEIVRDSSTKDNNEIVRDSSTKDNNEIVRDSSTKDNNEIVRDSSSMDNNEIVRDSSTKDNNDIVRDSSTKDNNEIVRDSSTKDNNEIVRDSSTKDNNEIVRDSSTKDNNEIVRDSSTKDNNEIVRDSSTKDNNEIVRDSSTKDNNEIVRDSSTKDNNEIVRDSSTKDNNEIVRDSSSMDNKEIVRDSSTKDNNEIVRDSSTKDNNEIVRDSSTKDNNEIVRDSSTKDNNEIVRDSSTKDNNQVSANSVSRDNNQTVTKTDAKDNNSNQQSNNENSEDAKTSKSTTSQTSTDAGSADETSGSCINRLDNCHLYTQKDCKQYPEWGNRNCRKYCNYCDVIETSTTTPTTKADSTCKDSNEHCAEYDDTVCKEYALWARKNCRRRCRFCTEQGAITTTKKPASTPDTACTDVSSDCVKYDKSVCETYKTWAKNNCRHFCGLC